MKVRRLTLLIVASFVFVACRGPSASVAGYTYELVNDLRGWVRIDYSVATCSPLEKRSRETIVKVPASRRVCTGATIDHSTGESRFYFVEGSQRRRLQLDPPTGVGIWWGVGGIEQCDEHSQAFEVFFVGTSEERRHAPDPPSCR